MSLPALHKRPDEHPMLQASTAAVGRLRPTRILPEAEQTAETYVTCTAMHHCCLAHLQDDFSCLHSKVLRVICVCGDAQGHREGVGCATRDDAHRDTCAVRGGGGGTQTADDVCGAPQLAAAALL